MTSSTGPSAAYDQGQTVIEDSDGDPEAAPSNQPDLESSVSSRKRNKHVELLENLLASLDSLIFIHLSALYYLDCTFAFLLLRTLAQLILLSARPPGIPHPASLSALIIIIGTNTLCILLHLINASPEAGESTRFYLHGSVLIDFVGQLGPTSKWRLVYMDVLVLALQVVMLGVGIEKRRIFQNPETKEAKTRVGRMGQDLEAEEEGTRRSPAMDNGYQGNEATDGIEMQNLLVRGSAAATAASEDETGGQVEDPNAHPLDEFFTGDVVLVRLHVVQTILRDIASADTTTTLSTSANEEDGVAGSTTGRGVFLPGILGLRWRTAG